MIYKILNAIFGWDYILWKNSADSGISRVHKEKGENAKVYYWRYKLGNKIDLIDSSNDVIWLTCDSNKYLD